MTTPALEKQVVHVGVRFYRTGGVELVLVPLLQETAAFTRSAGDGYFLVALMGEPGSAPTRSTFVRPPHLTRSTWRRSSSSTGAATATRRKSSPRAFG